MPSNRAGVRAPSDRGDDAGVSPLVGTLLMVAILVVLAATVTVFIIGFSSNDEIRKHVTFTVDEKEDLVVVVYADPLASWDGFSVILGSCTPSTANLHLGGAAAPHFNVRATSGSRTSLGGPGCSEAVSVQVAATSARIAAGNYLSFCSTGAAAEDVSIRLVEEASGSIAYQVILESVALCV